MMAALAVAALAGCGYKLGNLAGRELEGVKTVYVPVARNETYEPAISVLVTDALIRRLHADGTLRVARREEADATLAVVLKEIDRNPLRSARGDYRVTQEFRVNLRAEVTLTRKGGGIPIMNARGFTGRTEYFVGRDPQEGERQAMGLVAEDLANEIVLNVAEGW